jgi:Na+/H+ antiporter NhaA
MRSLSILPLLTVMVSGLPIPHVVNDKQVMALMAGLTAIGVATAALPMFVKTGVAQSPQVIAFEQTAYGAMLKGMEHAHPF